MADSRQFVARLLTSTVVALGMQQTHAGVAEPVAAVAYNLVMKLDISCEYLWERPNAL